MNNYKKAYIAGGCFWGMEDLFRKRPGVKDTEVGYQGGENDNPTYRNHPDHAEGIEITYDPSETSFKELLDFSLECTTQRLLTVKETIEVPVTARLFSFKMMKRSEQQKK